MSKSLVAVFTLGSATALTSLPAGEPLSHQQIDGILQELSTIEDVLNGKRVSLRTSAVQAFEAASASDKAAYEFFVQCHKVLNFDAKDASFSDFRKWRENNENRDKTRENLAAMRLQLQYLVLTMKAAEGVNREFIVPELESFVANIVNHTEELDTAGLRTLRGSVKSPIFAEAYKLNKSLEVEDWCFEPGNLGGVYEKTVFPYFREANPGALADAWDRRIALEKRSVLITRKDNDFGLNKFETERLPLLYWQKATDIYQNHSQHQGAQSMLALLKANPNHTSLKNWVGEFRSLLQTSVAQNSSEAQPQPLPETESVPRGQTNPEPDAGTPGNGSSPFRFE